LDGVCIVLGVELGNDFRLNDAVFSRRRRRRRREEEEDFDPLSLLLPPPLPLSLPSVGDTLMLR